MYLQLRAEKYGNCHLPRSDPMLEFQALPRRWTGNVRDVDMINSPPAKE